MTILDTPRHLPLSEDEALSYLTARVESRRAAMKVGLPAGYEQLEAALDTRDDWTAAEEAQQLHDWILNPEPQVVFPQRSVNLVRLNRNVAPACTPAFLDRQLARIWEEGGDPWFTSELA